MANKEELDKAIAAHGQWKIRLKTSIDTGKSETPVETIRLDNQCVFGKWLYGLSAADKASTHFQKVKELHAEFHKTAASVTEKAVSGKKAEAEKMIGFGGEYATISSKLTAAMMAWKMSLA